MKKVLTAAITMSLMAGSSIAETAETEESTSAVGASATVDFANAHIFRGATVVDEFVMQPGISVSGFGMPEEYGTITLGAWTTTAPFDDDSIGGVEGFDSFYETDWYIMYDLPEIVEGLELYIGLTEYTYEATLGALNEKELNLGAGYELGGFMLGASANFMIDDRNLGTEDQIYLDFTADYALDVSEDFDINVGGLISYMKQGDGNAAGPGGLDDGFNHYELYGAIGYELGELWSMGFSLSYIGQGDDKVLSNRAHDVSVLGMFSLACDM